MPQISIIVPVYKAEDFLNRCVQSIVNQTFLDFELILVEDGSPDQCPQLCDTWAMQDTRIKVIHKKNGGASTARNAGLAIAAGEYIAFVDSDDWVEPTMYETLFLLVQKYQVEMAICGMQVCSSTKKAIKKKHTSKVEIWSQTQLLDNFFRVHGESSPHSVWNRLIAKSLLQQYRFLEGKMNEDVETCYYLAAHCKKAVYTNEQFYCYYQNKQGVTHSNFTLKKLDLQAVWDIISKQVKRQVPEYTYACEMNQKRASFTLLCQMKLNGYNRKDVCLRQTNKRLKSEVRNAFWDLMRWKMPWTRKILLTIMMV